MSEQQVAYRLRSELDLQLAMSQLPHVALLEDVADARRGLLCTIAAELGSNMVKFAHSGELSVRRHREAGEDVVDILAVDSGPGIADVEAAVREHFSTAGTLGLGLPGVVRMADQVHIETGPGWGTSVRARSWLSARALAARERLTFHQRPGQGAPALPMRWAAHVRPYPGQPVCGDGVLLRPLPHGGLLVAVIDASGHGPRAHELAQRLMALLAEQGGRDVALLLGALHQACRGSCGAAAGLACIDAHARLLSYAGVGNVRARLVGPLNAAQAWSGVSRDGVLGDRFPTPLVQQVPVMAGQALLMYSDGLSESLRSFSGKLPGACDPSTLARQLIDQCGRMTDDASCAVVRFG